MAITQNSDTNGADVSHKREHTAFIDEDQRARYALDATRDGVWDWDITSGDVYFSPRWARLLGYEPEEVPQRVEFFFSIVHPDDVELVTTAVENHLAGLTKVKQDEVRLRTKSGEYQWFFDRGEVVSRDDEGRPVRMVGTITDITDRKQADARLNLQNEVLQRIASGASLHESLTLLVQLLDREMGGMNCSILLLDRDGKHLR
jgi:PAS domain S-box-containing protein